MSVGLPSRGWAGPRAGAFAPRRRSGLARSFAKGGVARSWDWPLVFVTCGLTVLGTLLVWAATEPSLRQAGLDPHTYLKKAALWARTRPAPDVHHRVGRLPADQALDPGHLRPVPAAPAGGARRGTVGERRQGLDRPARRLPGRAVGVRQARPDLVRRVAAVPAQAAGGRPDDQGRPVHRARRRPADRPSREGARARRHPGPGVHAGGHHHRVRNPDLLGARRPRGGGRRHLRGRQAATAAAATSWTA